MTETNPLDRLADLAGIERVYWDIWGNRYEISPETKRSILAALRIPAEDDLSVEESIVDLEEEAWRRVLPPVEVCPVGRPPSIPVVLPAEDGRAEIEWTLAEDEGGYRKGVLLRAEVPALDAREIDGRILERRSLDLGDDLPAGYHRLILAGKASETTMPLIVTPDRCHLPPSLSGGQRRWGIATQLYSVRSRTNWGIGDLTDLGDLLDKAAVLGADTVAINPLHALFPEDPSLASPYMPSSQLYLNPLYLDIVLIPDLADCRSACDLIASDDFSHEIAKARDGEHVDYPVVASLKRRVLELLYQSFRRVHLAAGSPRAGDFVRFQVRAGEGLRHFSVFQALTEHFGHGRWRDWPGPYRDPLSSEVKLFTRQQRERVEFFQYLQWQTDLQLETNRDRAGHAGLSLGIYRDLSVSVSPDGADAWAQQRVVACEGRIGAPPDPFNPLGQEWGSAPLHPHELTRTGYAHFIAILRANMRHAGALRVDHAMGLRRMFWIPAGATPESGAYVRYPFEDLLGILALESQRNHCVVIGEDLGTVPEGFRERMEEAEALSYRVLYFEKQGDAYRRPQEYPVRSLACAATHDLPTLSGFSAGRDLALRLEHSLYRSEAERRREGDERAHDRWLLLKALEAEGLLPEGIDPENASAAPMPQPLIDAVHVYLARSRAALFIVQIDDLFGETEQINLPGTAFERPNWRRRLTRDLEFLVADQGVQALGKAVTAARGGS